jgi:hypothetical protein
VEQAVIKPDIVFFGESLPEHFHRQMATDKTDLDLLIVIGSSLKVRPVALIPCRFMFFVYYLVIAVLKISYIFHFLIILWFIILKGGAVVHSLYFVIGVCLFF